MPTHWDSFIKLYEKEIPKTSIRDLLEAFYLYSLMDRTDAISKAIYLQKCNDIMMGK